MKYIAAITVLFGLFSYPAHADWGSWSNFIGYSGHDCKESNVLFPQMTEEVKDSNVQFDVIGSWRGEDGPNYTPGPCVNVPPVPLPSQDELCDSVCIAGDDNSIEAFAFGKLLEKYNCPGVECNLAASAIYHVEVERLDFQSCRKYHYKVEFVTAPEFLWKNRASPVYTLVGLIDGAGDSCWSNLWGCGGNNDW